MISSLLLWAAAPTLQGGVTLKTLASFGGTNGINPVGGLIRGAEGNFYGTTAYGGANELGTVFQMTPGGKVTTLASFDGINGAVPVAPLVQGKDGNFYGTTQFGGPFDKGTVFQATSNGILTSLFSFSGTNGANPVGGLAVGDDGNLYGTTFAGGDPEGNGTAFQITTNGALTTLVLFDGSNGANPAAGLALDADGNLYGTTVNGGGTNGYGTVFQLAPYGWLTTLFVFDGTNGAHPYAGLERGTDGAFYGVTADGGADDAGTAFRVTGEGSFTSLFSFTGGKDGAQPFATLLQGLDGRLYGSTAGAVGRKGTIFRFSPGGEFKTLLSLEAGQEPTYNAALVQGLDGHFYGTTASGGKEQAGSAFRLELGRRPVISILNPGKTAQLSNLVLVASGKAKGDGGVRAVFCRLNTNGWALATTTNRWTNWTALLPLPPPDAPTNAPLPDTGATTNLPDPGSLIVSAYSLNSNGVASLTNFVTPARVAAVLPLVVKTNGVGKVDPNFNGKLLELGAIYQMTAKPGKGCSFVDWTSNSTNWPADFTNTHPKLSFVMESNLVFTAAFVDKTAPVLQVTMPSANQLLTNAAITVIGRAKDNVRVTAVWFRLNDNDWAKANSTLNWHNWYIDVQLQPGANLFQAYAADNTGLVSPTNSTTFVLQPPEE